MVVINQRRPQALDGGNILLVETPVPTVDGDMWIVQGELSNVRRLIRAANFDRLSSSARPLRLIGQFDGGSRREEEPVVDAVEVLQEHDEAEETPKNELSDLLARLFYFLWPTFTAAFIGFFASFFI